LAGYDQSTKWKLEMVMNMSKAKLIKKDSPLQEQLLQKRKQRRQRVKQVSPTRTAFEITTEWLKAKRNEAPSARESFAALFAEGDPQSA
jgi:hypothetical protein